MVADQSYILILGVLSTTTLVLFLSALIWAFRLKNTVSGEQLRRAEAEVRLEEERKKSIDRERLLSDLQNQNLKQLGDKFDALASQALRVNNDQFLKLASESLGRFQTEAKGVFDKKSEAIDMSLKPISEALDRFGQTVHQMEKARAGAYEGLITQVRSLQETEKELRIETTRLSTSLRSPIARGRWGEIQLRRVVELAGMQDHCDFYEQATVTGEAGTLRPDMIIRLPGNKTVVVDAKVPLSAYLDSLESKDETARLQKITEHAQQIRSHIQKLEAKAYWEQFENSPDFAVLFLPGEIYFSAAVERDPALIEDGLNRKIILASPTTLIALLRAVSYGWRQQSVEENARKISELGRELYKRMGDMTDHVSKLGRSLNLSVESYNRAVSTLETRVLVSARKMTELDPGLSKDTLLEIAPIDQVTREPRRLEPPPDPATHP